MPPDHDLVACRTAIARAARAVRKRPDDMAALEKLGRVRQDYAEAQLAEHIQQVVAKAPPLSDEQRGRLAALLTASGGDAT